MPYMSPEYVATRREEADGILARVKQEMKRPTTNQEAVMRGRCIVTPQGMLAIRPQAWTETGTLPRNVQGIMAREGWKLSTVNVRGFKRTAYTLSDHPTAKRRKVILRAQEAKILIARINKEAKRPSDNTRDIFNPRAVRIKTGRILVRPLSFGLPNEKVPRHIQVALLHDGWIPHRIEIDGHSYSCYRKGES